MSYLLCKGKVKVKDEYSAVIFGSTQISGVN
jgi:hypothetical protein